MKVKELINWLQTLPQDYEVSYYYDGGLGAPLEIGTHQSSLMCVHTEEEMSDAISWNEGVIIYPNKNNFKFKTKGE